MDDIAIIQMYNNRDQNAISETNKKYGSYCFIIANNILENKEDSEECVNDTWLRTWNSIPPKNPSRFRIFLAKITRNLSFDKYRSSNRKKRSGELLYILDELSECVSGGNTTDNEVNMMLLGESLNKFLKSLSDRDRGIFLRRYFYAESVTAIAERYDISANNVSAVLSRTRIKLKAYLIKEGFEV